MHFAIPTQAGTEWHRLEQALARRPPLPHRWPLQGPGCTQERLARSGSRARCRVLLPRRGFRRWLEPALLYKGPFRLDTLHGRVFEEHTKAGRAQCSTLAAIALGVFLSTLLYQTYLRRTGGICAPESTRGRHTEALSLLISVFVEGRSAPRAGSSISSSSPLSSLRKRIHAGVRI